MKIRWAKVLSYFHSFLLFCANTALGQSPPDTIPFTLNKQHNICVKARINNSDTLTLMFHSSATGVTLVREAVEGKSFIKPGKSTEVTSWGGKSEAQFSENNMLSISRLSWDSLTVFVNEFSGPDTDGKFGFDLFEGRILFIDYDRRQMIVYRQLPELPKGFERSKLFIRGGSTFIPGELNIGRGIYRDTFMFHTGYGGAVLLDPQIGERFGLKQRLKTVGVSELKDAYGNVFKIETKSLPFLRVGRKKLKNVPLSFAARPSAIPMKVFGNGLLRRFNTVFDFQKSEVYLQPNGFWKEGY